MRDWPQAWRIAAQKAVDFFETRLRLVKGSAAGQPYLLPPWFEALVRRTFGPLDADGRRIARVMYLEVARKNSKSTAAGGLALYMLAEDGEAGAECYTAAHDRKQARIVFQSAQAMASKSAYLNNELGGKLAIATHHIEMAGDRLTKLEPVSADSGGQQGLDPHCLIIDELHVLTRELVEVLDTSQGSRSQPLTVYITTAGEYDPESVAWERHEYARGVVDGTIVDPTWVAAIYTVPPDCDISDERNWSLANPNLGVSVSLDFLRAQYRKALKSPAAMSAFERYHLNRWVNSTTSWIEMADWNRNLAPVDMSALAGRVCCSGLDLSTSRDLTAHVLAFPAADGFFDIVARFFMPRERMIELAESDGVPYAAWVRDGWITPTEGNEIHFDAIEASIEADWKQFGLKELAYDRHGATHLAQRLEAKYGPDSNLPGSRQIVIAKMAQGFHLSEFAKDLHGLARAGKLRTGGNPVLSWMASCVSVKTDDLGNWKLVKPQRKTNSKRIDGIVALTMAIARAKYHAVAAEVKKRPMAQVVAFL